jgi:DNA modification methylase
VETKVLSAKLKKSDSRVRYYAGFSESFVKDAIASSDLHPESIILDPWNGSGMTTSVANMLGYDSIGFDINPATGLYAYSRFIDKKGIKKAQLYFQKWKELNYQKYPKHDFLWFSKRSTQRLSLFKSKIFSLENKVLKNFCSYVAVQSMRKQLSGFKSSNPTWIKKPNDSTKTCFSFKQWFADCNNLFQDFINTQEIPNTLPELRTRIEEGSSLQLPLVNNSVDCVITSPPYCTRLDYVVMTMPELVWLGLDSQQIKTLRGLVTGTPTVTPLKDQIDLGRSISRLLKKIKNHDSLAAEDYYYKIFKSYFIDMEISFNEIGRVIKPDGFIHLVVQDSKFKDLDINLSKLFLERLCSKGFTLIDESRVMGAGFNYIKGNKDINEVIFRCQKS